MVGIRLLKFLRMLLTYVILMDYSLSGLPIAGKPLAGKLLAGNRTCSRASIF